MWSLHFYTSYQPLLLSFIPEETLQEKSSYNSYMLNITNVLYMRLRMLMSQ